MDVTVGALVYAAMLRYHSGGCYDMMMMYVCIDCACCLPMPTWMVVVMVVAVGVCFTMGPS